MAERTHDPLAALRDLPGIETAIDAARTGVDAVLWDRAVGRHQVEVRTESALRGAWASAWFEGAECGLAQLRSGEALDGSPMGRLLGNAVALRAELPELVGVIGSAPSQALARMHAVAAHGFAPESELGRPRASGAADDPLRLGAAPPAAEVADRLAALAGLLRSSTAPGVLVACVAHAEVASLRPFGWGSGLVARALLPLVLAQRGVDPGFLTVPEVGLRQAGRPAVVRVLRSYAQGSPAGVTGAVELVADAIGRGAREPIEWAAGLDG